MRAVVSPLASVVEEGSAGLVSVPVVPETHVVTHPCCVNACIGGVVVMTVFSETVTEVSLCCPVPFVKCGVLADCSSLTKLHVRGREELNAVCDTVGRRGVDTIAHVVMPTRLRPDADINVIGTV